MSSDTISGSHTQIWGDFANLGGCNAAIGRPFTNDIIAIGLSMMQAAIMERCPSAQIIVSRSAGDEFCFTIMGMEQYEADIAIQRAEEYFAHFIFNLGLLNIKHSKSEHADNTTRNGVWIAAISTPWVPNTAQSPEIIAGYDAEIEEKKILLRESLTPEKKAQIADQPHEYNAFFDFIRKQRMRETIREMAENYKQPQIQNARPFIADTLKKIEGNYSILRMDVRNLAGLNSAYGHGTADEIIESFKDIIQKQLGNIEVIDVGGGVLYAILLESWDRSTIESTLITLNKKIQEVIPENVSKTGNPKRQDSPGTGLVMAVTSKVHSQTAKMGWYVTLDLLDRLTQLQKDRGITFAFNGKSMAFDESIYSVYPEEKLENSRSLPVVHATTQWFQENPDALRATLNLPILRLLEQATGTYVLEEVLLAQCAYIALAQKKVDITKLPFESLAEKLSQNQITDVMILDIRESLEPLGFVHVPPPVPPAAAIAMDMGYISLSQKNALLIAQLASRTLDILDASEPLTQSQEHLLETLAHLTSPQSSRHIGDSRDDPTLQKIQAINLITKICSALNQADDAAAIDMSGLRPLVVDALSEAALKLAEDTQQNTPVAFFAQAIQTLAQQASPTPRSAPTVATKVIEKQAIEEVLENVQMKLAALSTDEVSLALPENVTVLLRPEERQNIHNF